MGLGQSNNIGHSRQKLSVLISFLFSFVLFSLIGQPASSNEPPGAPPIQNPYIFGLINSEEQANNVGFFSRYALALVAAFPDQNPFPALRELNPNIKLLAMANPYFPTGFTLYPDYTHPENKRPDWVLRTKRGEVISYAGPLYANMTETPSIMDLRVNEWQDEFIGFNRILLDMFGLDGILLDTWTSELPVWAYQNNRVPPVGYSDRGWGEMMLSFTDKLRAAMSDKLVIYNGLTVAPGEKGLGDIAYLDMMDGAAYEAYSIYLKMDNSAVEKKYYFDHAIMNAMVRAQEADRYFLLQAAGNETNRESRLYAYGAFLLNAYDKSYFYYDEGDEDAPNWFSEWNIALGAPLARATHSDGLYLRRFEKALILVNPRNENATFTGDQIMYNADNIEVSGELILKPFSAMILRFAL